MKKTLGMATAVLVLTAALNGAEDKKADKVKLPVTAKLVAKDAKYKLDLGGKTTEEFKQLIKDTEKKGGRLPPSPTVDLVLEITNTSDKDVKIFHKGDPVHVTLKLEGPGAVNAKGLGAFTTEFRIPEAMTLAPGKTHSIPIKNLQHGFRGVAQQSYWTEPGEYKLTADFATGIHPAPEGSKPGMDGFGMVTVTSEPLKITVEK